MHIRIQIRRRVMLFSITLRYISVATFRNDAENEAMHDSFHGLTLHNRFAKNCFAKN